jgi:hypothetical protein
MNILFRSSRPCGLLAYTTLEFSPQKKKEGFRSGDLGGQQTLIIILSYPLIPQTHYVMLG